MPFAPVNADGVVLYFEDSGAPPSAEVYTTLVLAHGTGFHSAVFHKIFALAPAHGVRLIVLNRRDFDKSTPYTPADVAKLTARPVNGDEASLEETRRSFFRDRGAEFVAFLVHIVDNLGIPPIEDKGGKGGLSFMAWSAGNMFAIPLLAYADEVDEETRRKLEPYFRKLVLFDPPKWPLGPTHIDSMDKILIDESLPPPERGRIFGEWVSGYYTHRSLTSRNYDDLELLKPDTVPAPTTTQMTLEEIIGMTSSLGAESDMRVQEIDPWILAEQTRRALFDEGVAKAWPRVEVEHILCDRSAWVMIDGLWWLETLQAQAGGKGRNITFTRFPGANHFPHWDMPGETMKLFTERI